MKRILATTLSLALFGCATPETTHLILGPTFDPVPVETVKVDPGYYTNWTFVAQISCRAYGSDQKAADQAMNALKADAAKLGANQIVVTSRVIHSGWAYVLTANVYRR
jgi:hypothetical protein